MKHIIRTSTAVLLAGLAVAGCKTSPPASEAMTADTALTNAGQAVDHAAADPHVAKYASSELDRANDSLQKAKEAWSKTHDLSATTHLAYVAQQRAVTAQELANGRAADDAREPHTAAVNGIGMLGLLSSKCVLISSSSR